MNIILFEHLPEDGFLPAGDFRYEHISKILGLKAGDSFVCGVVGGPKGKAVITDMDESGLHFTFEVTDKDASRMYPVTLLIAHVRPICMRRILRECVDLGVETIVLATCDLTEKSYQNAKLYTTGEYKDILLNGAMQSGKTGMSDVRFADTLDQALTKIPSGARKLMLDNVVGTEVLGSLTVKPGERVVMAIGPERGFSDRERKLLSEGGFEPVLVGTRILRTETVCSAATAVLLGRMGLI